MTTCPLRFTCWHEDTCGYRGVVTDRPGCWMSKGDGWREEPDGIGRVVSSAYHSSSINDAVIDDAQTYKTIESAIETLREIKDSEQGVLF